MVAAEEFGFDSAWLTEHHFGNDPKYNPFGLDGSEHLAYDLSADPLTILGHVAAKTTKLRLGTGVIVLHYDNPIRVAERAALLDVMSDGRVELGVGRGGGKREPAAFHVPVEANRQKFQEALEILQLAWTGEEFSYEGKFYSIPTVAVIPKPVQQPGIPLYLASSSPESFQYAGEHGLPYAYAGGAWGKSGWDKFTVSIDIYNKAAQKAGHDLSNIPSPQVVFAYCADTDEEAYEVARYHVLQYQAMIEAHYERQRYANLDLGSAPPGSVEDRQKSIEAQVQDILDSDIIGSPATCIAKLQRYRDHFKSRYMLFSVGFGCIPHDLAMASMERLSRYVLPSIVREREVAVSRR